MIKKVLVVMLATTLVGCGSTVIINNEKDLLCKHSGGEVVVKSGDYIVVDGDINAMIGEDLVTIKSGDCDVK